MGDELLRMAVECGADTIEHAFACTPAAADVLLRDGLTFCPNLVVTETWDRDAVCCRGLPEWMAENAVAARSGHHELFARAVELGVAVCAGVDNLPRTGPHDYGIEHAGQVIGLVRELQLMRSLGLGAEETLRAATLNAAVATGVGARSGSLEPGKAADFIVVDEDPLHDVAALQSAQQVWLAGRRAH